MRSRLADAAFVMRMAMEGVPKRHLREWLRSLEPDYLVARPSPWMVFGAIDYLDRFDRPNLKVFEFGSGGSTLYWLERGATVTSVEHDRAWFEALQGRLPRGAKLDYRLVPPEQVASPPGDPADPFAYASGDGDPCRSFERYVRQIDDVPDDTLDVVVIDGRARPACVRHAVPKIAPGGIIVLDNAERPYYRANIHQFLERFRAVSFVGMLPCCRWKSRTDIYEDRRPV